jgi:hypothetical protein
MSSQVDLERSSFATVDGDAENGTHQVKVENALGGETKKEHEDDSDTSSQIADNLAALTDVHQKQYVEKNKGLRKLQRLAEVLSRYQIEGIGIAPLTLEQRKGRQWWSPGFLWFSANVNGESIKADYE